MAPKKREVSRASDERTSAKVASSAAKILKSKTASKAAKAVAASALTQRSSETSSERATIKALIVRNKDLERVCAELYQVIGALADEAGLFDHPDVIRALDQASQARIVHDDLLPRPRQRFNR